MKVKVKLKNTLYTNEGYKYAGDILEYDKQDANDLAAKGIVELLDAADKTEPKEKKEILYKKEKIELTENPGADNPAATITIKDGKKLKK